MVIAMRKLVFQMMTTLNGRLDNPFEWVTGVSDDQYRAIETHYQGYDTILVGRTTFDEMASYWPSALESGEGTVSNQRMAQHMHDYRKLVFSRSGARALPDWNNSALVVAADDQALIDSITALKAQSGRDIQLSGGAEFARAVIALGLVDTYHFFVYPTVSAGPSWFGGLQHRHDMALVGATPFDNGVVELTYEARGLIDMGNPQRFTELLK